MPRPRAGASWKAQDALPRLPGQEPRTVARPASRPWQEGLCPQPGAHTRPLPSPVFQTKTPRPRRRRWGPHRLDEGLALPGFTPAEGGFLLGLPAAGGWAHPTHA